MDIQAKSKMETKQDIYSIIKSATFQYVDRLTQFTVSFVPQSRFCYKT